MPSQVSQIPFYGAGFECGHDYDETSELEETLKKLPIIEIIPEGFFHGKRSWLLKCLANTGIPTLVHSVDMSLGTDEPFRQKHFDQIREVMDKINCAFFSDHICMTRANDIDIGQLTTLPFTQDAADAFCRNAETMLKQLGSIPFIGENITNRFMVPHSTMTETDFINSITRRTGIGLLLDVTNAYTNSVNFRFDPLAWIEAIDAETVVGIHLAGGEWEDGTLYDSHSRAVPQEVWQLYNHVLEIAQPRAVIVEWDGDAPSLSRLRREVRVAQIAWDKMARRGDYSPLPDKVVNYIEESCGL